MFENVDTESPFVATKKDLGMLGLVGNGCEDPIRETTDPTG